jgi:cobyric acid synthase
LRRHIRAKILQRGNYQLFSYTAIKGYEIHCGRMNKYPLFYQSGRFTGTHVHGIFDDDAFRGDYFKAINPQYQGFDYAHYRDVSGGQRTRKTGGKMTEPGRIFWTIKKGP